jgi:predicted dehydrogenase
MGVPLRIGLIGLDTSHAGSFTEILNGPNSSHPAARVVYAFPGGAPDWELSWSRIEGITAHVKTLGVEILSTPEAVAQGSDLIFITEVDGRMHPQLLERVISQGKPVFVDKPFATNMKDAMQMLALTEARGVPLMSCSALRYAQALTRALADTSGGAITGVDVFGPMALQDAAPGLLWYGVHGMEMVVRVMGTGCREIQAVQCENGEVHTMTWEDGRLATYRGLRKSHSGFGAVIHREKNFQMIDMASGGQSYYADMLDAILRSLPEGRSDVPPAEMLEVVRLMEAGNQARHSPRAVRLT